MKITTRSCVITAMLLVAALPVASAAAVDAQTFTVTTAADSGPGSLRQAILDANAAGEPGQGINSIVFAIPGTGLHTIRPLTILPVITHPVLIDGYTQPGSVPSTQHHGGSNAVLTIELDGSLAGPSADGLVYGPGVGSSFVRGLAINRFGGAGIELLHGAVGVYVQGNFIGTDASGQTARGNGIGIVAEHGVFVGQEASDVNLDPALVNVVSGNSGAGILVTSSSLAYGEFATGVIRNNVIGGDASGTAAMGNGGDGIEYSVFGPYPEYGTGIVIADNVIVANHGNGITTYSSGTILRNNRIGVGAGDRTAGPLPALGNLGDGVYVGGDAMAVSLANTVSGFGPHHANIAHNGGAGLFIDDSALVDSQSQFADNGGLGIDIAPEGPNPDDADDADTGPNERLNTPVLDNASFDTASGYGDLVGHLDSNPGQDVEVRYFLGAGCDDSGFGEGDQPLRLDAQTTGTRDTDAAGHTTFTLHSPQLLPGVAVTAVSRRFAIDATTSMIVSEFSNCLVVPGGEVIFADGFEHGLVSAHGGAQQPRDTTARD